MKKIKRIKPVRAWAVVSDGEIITSQIFHTESCALSMSYCYKKHRVIQVEIRHLKVKR